MHRSLTLWSGLLIFAFLLIAHLDSRHTSRQIPMHGKGHGLTIENTAGKILLTYLAGYEINPHLDVSSGPLFREHLSPMDLTFPSPLRSRTTLPDAFGGAAVMATHTLAFPHWLLLVVTLILWLLLLYWRHRRIRRAGKPIILDA